MHHLRAFATFFCLVALQSGCAASAPATNSNAVGRTIILKVGESAAIDADDLTVGFDSVERDSRCPKGENCIWQGDATVRIWVQRAHATRNELELHTAATKQRPSAVEGWYFHVEALTPYPISGRIPDARAYSVKLSMSRTAPDDDGLR